MNNYFDNQSIFQLIWRRRIHFVVIGLAAILLSALFSGPAFIKPKFRSVAKIYPTNLEVFSEESETEQMLEILSSRDITLKMFDTFQLDEVYKIDKADPLYMTYMLDKYNKNVGAGKTKFETVEIRVMDYDPQRASDMCDSIIHFYNKKVRELHKAKAYEMIEIIEKELNKKYAELTKVVDELNSLRKNYGILEYEIQVERVTEGYMTALAEGRTSAANLNEIRKLYDNLALKGAEAVYLKNRHLFLLKAIDELFTSYDLYLVEYEKDITYSHRVENPIPADKKTYPVRWLIVAFSLMGTLFLGLVVFLILDYRKND